MPSNIRRPAPPAYVGQTTRRALIPLCVAMRMNYPLHHYRHAGFWHLGQTPFRPSRMAYPRQLRVHGDTSRDPVLPRVPHIGKALAVLDEQARESVAQVISTLSGCDEPSGSERPACACPRPAARDPDGRRARPTCRGGVGPWTIHSSPHRRAFWRG
jgi:hypothetical protein